MIYLPTNMQPKNSTINGTVANTFSAQVNGTIITAYQLKIYNNDTGTLLYDSTKITLTTPLYDKDILNVNINANTITNSQNCKWTLTVWDDSNNSTTSGEVFFKVYGNPTVTLTIPSTISSQTYTAKATYSHPQNIAVKKFHYLLYDVDGNVIKDTGYFFSANLSYVFDGFFNNTSYQIECIVIDQNDITVSSGKQSFTISYSSPNVIVVPNTQILADKSAIDVMWGKAVQLSGSSYGNVSYANNFIRSNNKAVSLNANIKTSQLQDTRNSIVINPLFAYNPTSSNLQTTSNNTFVSYGTNNIPTLINQVNTFQITDTTISQITDQSSVNFPVGIPIDFNLKFKIQFLQGFIGVFVSLDNSYQVGYDGTRFYFNNKGSYFYGQPTPLPTNPIYVVIRPTDVFIDGVRLGF